MPSADTDGMGGIAAVGVGPAHIPRMAWVGRMACADPGRPRGSPLPFPNMSSDPALDGKARPLEI